MYQVKLAKVLGVLLFAASLSVVFSSCGKKKPEPTPPPPMVSTHEVTYRGEYPMTYVVTKGGKLTTGGELVSSDDQMKIEQGSTLLGYRPSSLRRSGDKVMLDTSISDLAIGRLEIVGDGQQLKLTAPYATVRATVVLAKPLSSPLKKVVARAQITTAELDLVSGEVRPSGEPKDLSFDMSQSLSFDLKVLSSSQPMTMRLYFELEDGTHIEQELSLGRMVAGLSYKLTIPLQQVTVTPEQPQQLVISGFVIEDWVEEEGGFEAAYEDPNGEL